MGRTRCDLGEFTDWCVGPSVGRTRCDLGEFTDWCVGSMWVERGVT